MTTVQKITKTSMKKRCKKTLLHMFFSFFLIFLCFFSSHALARKAPVYAAIVIDVSSGSILHQENANASTYPASLTKMMTLLMTFDALNRGQIRLNEKIPISSHAASMVPSKIGLPPGSTIKVEDAILALVTKSANDIAVALAERLGGSESNFALMMTNKAKKLGMTKTRFKNASGLHNPGQITTAHDMARLSLTLINDYRLYYRYFSTKNFHFRGKSYHNHNRLLGVYPGMDGLKTGYIVPSGFNLAASAVREKKRIVGVVMGGRTAQSRNKQMVKILDRAFAQLGSSTYVANNNARPIEQEEQHAANSVPIPGQKPIYISQTKDVYTSEKTAVDDVIESLASTDPASSSYLPAQGIHTDAPSAPPASDAQAGESAPLTAGERWAMLSDETPDSLTNRMIGNGENSESAHNRIETGLVAISVIKKSPRPPQQQLPEKMEISASGTPVPEHPQAIEKQTQDKIKPAYISSGEDSGWTIQIGAYSTRDRTNKALGKGISQLPQSLRYANAMISPLKTENGWVYRARLTGYSKQAANQACSILPDCLVLSPNAKH